MSLHSIFKDKENEDFLLLDQFIELMKLPTIDVNERENGVPILIRIIDTNEIKNENIKIVIIRSLMLSNVDLNIFYNEKFTIPLISLINSETMSDINKFKLLELMFSPSEQFKRIFKIVNKKDYEPPKLDLLVKQDDEDEQISVLNELLVSRYIKDIEIKFKMFKLIIEYGADLNAIGFDGNSLLFNSIFAGQEASDKFFNFLMQQENIDVNFKTLDGLSILSIIIQQQFLDDKLRLKFIEKILENENVDVNSQDRNGNTALMLAIVTESIKMESKQTRMAIIKLILENDKINLDLKRKDGKTAIELAKRKGLDSFINNIISQKTESNSRDEKKSNLKRKTTEENGGIKKQTRIECEICSKEATKTCSACKMANYCSLECQRIHWVYDKSTSPAGKLLGIKSHKIDCSGEIK